MLHAHDESVRAHLLEGGFGLEKESLRIDGGGFLAHTPADFADDDAEHYRYLVQVHLYAPLEKNTRAYRREISRRLVAAGFTRPTVTPASDDHGQHYAFECEIAGGVDDG